MDKKLPSRPNLLHLKRQAKELLAALAAGDPVAARTLIEHLPAARGLSPATVAKAGFRLADAQSALARQSGFVSWPKLARHVEQLRGLEGDWRFLGLEVDGEPLSPSMLHGARILIDGDRFKSEMHGDVYDGEFMLDVEADPHTIDIEFVAGPEAGNWSYGIFQLEGERLTICLGLTGHSRPASFTTAPGSGHALETLVRSTAERPIGVTGGDRGAAPRPTPVVAWQSGPVTAEHRRLEGEWQAVQLERDGATMPAAFVKSGRRIGKGTHTVVRFGGQTMVDAETRIDASQSPITIDYRLQDGTVQLGIFEWTDLGMRVCFAMPGQPRPTGFVTVSGSGWTMSSWRRL